MSDFFRLGRVVMLLRWVDLMGLGCCLSNLFSLLLSGYSSRFKKVV
jgi:hypothetical protein